MKDYNIVKIPTDYSIIEANLHKLNFIKGVALYYDKTKTDREVFKTYTNFNSWIEAYSKEHSIPFFEFRTLIKSLVQDVQVNLLDFFEPHKTFPIPEDFWNKLNAIKKVGPAGEPYSYHTLLSLIFQHLPIENNYSIVCEDGSFLMSKVNMILPFFYNNIQITEHGIFKCEKREYGYDRCFPGNVTTSNVIYYWDFAGNYIRDFDFDTSLKILSNCNTDHLTLLSERKNFNFNVGKGEYFEYREKYEGKESVEWEKLLSNGLTFYYTEHTLRGSDYRYYADPYVRDQLGNTIGIDAFYLSLEILKNGKEYLRSLIADSIKKQIEKLK